MIGIIGDTHLGKIIHQHDLTPYIRHMMWKFFEFCIERKVKIAVHLGDVFDSPRPTLANEKVLVQWANEFERAGIKLFLLTGNHDVTAHKAVSSALAVLKASPYEHVQVIDRPHAIVAGALSLLFLPFPSPSLFSNYNSYLEEVTEAYQEAQGNTCIFSHLNVEGVKLGTQDFVYRGADFHLPLDITDRKDVVSVVNGHIHKTQTLEGVHMLGAAQRTTFGERDNDVRFGFIDNSGDLKVRSVSTHAINLQQIEIDASAQQGSPITTEQAIARLPLASFEGAGVKITSLVDANSLVDFGEVEEVIYDAGALFVAMGSPINVERQKKQDAPALVKDFSKAAKAYIGEVSSNEDEQEELFARFNLAREQAS